MSNHIAFLLITLVCVSQADNYCKHISYGSRGADPEFSNSSIYIHNYVSFHFKDHIGWTKAGALADPCILDIKLPNCLYFHITREPIYGFTYYISPVPDWVNTNQNMEKHFTLNISWWGSEWDFYVGTNTELVRYNITCPV